MSPTDRSARVDLNIPMIPDMELTVAQTAGAMGEFMKLDADKIEEIKMALIEACINAFEHSQSEDERVSITFDIGVDELIIQITDQGKGFDVAKAREDLEARHESGQHRRGWGLTLMEEMMDEVEVESSEQGTCITMVKRR